MRRHVFTEGKNRYERIDKHTARAVFEHGRSVILCPVKMRIGGFWDYGVEVSNKHGESFDNVVNSFEYYNCCNETGKYAAFYVKY